MEVELKQYDGQTVTAQDDAILNDQLYGLNGIISGCNMNFISVNVVNIEEGYGLIKGREFRVKESTINCMLPDANGVGIIKLRMDLMNSSRPAELITEAVSGDVYPELEQDEDCNFNNGIYEIELARYTATAVAITKLTKTFDVLEKKSINKIKSEIGEIQKNISDINNDLSIITNTLTTGNTQVEIESERINSNCALTFYASIYGVSPEEVIVEDGKVTLTFDAQETDMIVGVRIDA